MQAVSDGRWLLIEDINLAPPDVLASLVGLLEQRQLYLPQRAQSIAAHPGFQLIASVTSSPGVLQHPNHEVQAVNERAISHDILSHTVPKRFQSFSGPQATHVFHSVFPINDSGY